ncbi:PREDICTED: uncharacterized protein LOC100638997 [Amphimedon queenslandica]|nr:PREDICTED: uncharacterized protein LOC100638997 [Amphimedon queenslandica]|eukprot:XP_003389853.2 PREDICTED: uncharacterized protein LOC100638997 [Amphimedon queenslandica]
MLMNDQSRRSQVLDHTHNTNNNNNNARPPRIPSADSATSGFASSPDTPTYLKNKLTAAKVGVWSHYTHSVESGIEQELAWYQSTTPSPSHGATPTITPPTNGLQSDGEDYDHLSKDVPSSSTLSLSAPPLSPVLSPRTVPPQPPQAGGNPSRPPLDLSSLSPVLQPAVSAKIHRGHEGSFMRALSPHYSSFHSRHYSDSVYPLKATPTTDTPPLSAGPIRRTRGSSYTSSSPNNHSRRPYHQYSTDPPTGGSPRGWGQELIHSFDRLVSATPPQSPGKRGVVFTSTDGTLNRRPRASEYTDTTTRTPGYKSVGSVSSAGADSGVELLRRTTAYVIPKSTSNSTNISYDANSLGTYEVTLKKSPTLGLGITGGKDGENAIKPGDKGFYVFRLVNNLPAAKCGKISIGDKILAVNSVDVSNLLNEQLVKLLTSEDVYVTILFAREPSITLL